MEMVSVRYFVKKVDDVVDFYVKNLNFTIKMKPGSGFAMLLHGNLRLLLNEDGVGGAGQAMPGGARPGPGGWNRFLIEVDDLEKVVNKLRENGATFRNDIISGMGGKQILLEDPSGNPVELFEQNK